LHARKRRQILQEIDIANVTNTKKTFPNLDEMTDLELKQKWKEYGIASKVRKHEKVIDMLKTVQSCDQCP